MLSDFVGKVKSGEISVTGYAQKICSEIDSNNPEFNHFNFYNRENILQQAIELEKKIKKGFEGKLLGVPISVKDCLCVKGMESRSSSKILSGYYPLFDATAVANAKKEGVIILGKTVQDEFGFGTFSVNVGAGEIPKNPLDKDRSCGGSSGGAAGFTALTEFEHVAIAESTGGSIACPASFCGVASITPTYGLVSRYGLMDYSNSLDKIGTMGKTISDASLLLDVIKGKDEKDSTSLPCNEEPEKDSFIVGVPKDLFDAVPNEDIKKIVMQKIKKAESKGVEVKEVNLPLNTEFGLSVYYLIAMTEASTNLAKYCGMRYGLEKKLEGTFNDYFSEVRNYFTEEAKRRILIGTFARMSGFRDAYYLKAMKARTKLIKEFKGIFEKVDFLCYPAMPVIAPKFSEIEKMSPLENYAMDQLTVPPNLAGLPHSTINSGFLNEMPVGLMVVGTHLSEKNLISFSSFLEGLV